MSDRLNGKRAAFLMANEGVEQVELTEPRKAIEAAGAEIDLLAPEAGLIQAFDHLDKGDRFEVDRAVADADAGDGPWTLIEADVVKGRTLTSWPSLQTDLRNAGANWVDEEVHVDQGLVMSRNPDDLPALNAKLVEEFAAGVHAGQRASIGH
jgi:protease I